MAATNNSERCVPVFSVKQNVGLACFSSPADFIHHHGNNTLGSSYSAPPYYLRKGVDGSVRAGSVLRVTNDLSGRRQVDWRRPASEAAYGTRRPRSEKGTV